MLDAFAEDRVYDPELWQSLYLDLGEVITPQEGE